MSVLSDLSSAHSSIENITSLSQSQRSKNPHTELFKDIVRSAGIVLSPNENPNSISKEQALVVQAITNKLKTNEDEAHIQKFTKGFRILIKKEKYFRKALLPTQFRVANLDSEGHEIVMQQESLFRIFLKVPQLQQNIIEIILDELTTKAIEDNQDTSWLRLLLSQLRYLPHIKSAETLTTKLLDIMEIASFPSQLEILDSIPEILPDSEYTNTANQLSKLLDENDELCAAIIDCLNALQLTPETRSQVQDHILSKLLMGTSTKTFAIFLEFLLQDYKSAKLNGILIRIRNALDKIMSANEDDTNANSERDSNKIVIFQRLQRLATTPKTMSDAWLSIIGSFKAPSDHKPIDILLLIMLHSSSVIKKRNIEIFLRKKVKDGLLKCSLLQQLFDKYLPQQLLRDYFPAIVDIGSGLLRTSNEPIVTEFASTLFITLFNNQFTETIFRQELLDNLILLTGLNEQKNVGIILNIFIKLIEDIQKVQHHTVLFMRLLEKLDLFTLKDTKTVFEILCQLTCSDDTLSGLKQELHMIIRKQLSCAKRQVKHRGIIAAVVMAKHIATVAADEEQSEINLSEDSILTVANLNGNAKEAALILELANQSTSHTAEFVGLFYDELASMVVTAPNLDKHFMAWLFETITNDFQNVFICESLASQIIDDVELKMQLNLNAVEELETPIAVNIGELTMKSENANVILKLAPHFRLLRLLHYRQQSGDLSSIDALLGCPIILPVIDSFDSYNNNQMKEIVDCLFHCINWFREIISGFVSQKCRKLRYKVIQRLDNLIEIENTLFKHLHYVPEHNLPISYFDKMFQLNNNKQTSPPSTQKDVISSKRGRLNKKQKVATNNETTANITSTFPSTSRLTGANKPTKSKSTSSYNFDVNFRQIDIDLVILLKYPSSDESAANSVEQTTITIPQLNFILKDFVKKLTLVINNKITDLSHLNTIAPDNLIKDCVKIFTNINTHFQFINDKIEALLNENAIDDAEMYTEEANNYKTAFGLILETFALVFGWSGFQHSKRLDLLRDLLRALRKNTAMITSSQQPTPSSANRLVIEFIQNLAHYENHCLQLNHAVNLIRIMEALYNIIPCNEIRIQISKTSGNLLKQLWYNQIGLLDTGRIAATNIDILIKSYLSSACIKTICGLVGTLQNQSAHLLTKNDRLEMLQSVDKMNFYLLYRNLWNVLHERIKFETQQETSSRKLLHLWKTIALTMQGLMTIVKTQESRSNLISFLKKSIVVLKIFLSNGISILELLLKTKPDEVVEVLKTIQSNTRFLHHLCCHSKLIKDTSLMAYVPQFRLTLETLIYRVKAALVANGCSDAFWMGNLKNRDLHGEDILSQSTTASEETAAEDENEELPEDDEQLFSDEEADSESRSVSEVFE